MKGISLLVFLGCLAAEVCCFDVSAAVPLEDQGDTTYDPNTGLEWLDLSFTAGRSYHDVVNGWNGLTTAQGYRFAGRTEIDTFFNHAGRSSTDSRANLAAANQALVLLGTTLGEASQRRSWMMYDPASEPDVASTHVPAAVFGVGELGGGISGEQGFFLVPGLIPMRDYASPEIGSALVRVIPEPKSWVLFLGASLMLVLLSARSRK